MKKLMAVLALAAATVGSGCDGGVQGPCPPYPGVGLVVTVMNDQTGEPICDAVVTAQARDGAPWTMSASTSRCAYTGSGSGTYSVRAERAGFHSGSLMVQVARTRGECPIAVETPVTIRLAPLPYGGVSTQG